MKGKHFGRLSVSFALALLAAAPQAGAQQTAKPPDLSGVWLTPERGTSTKNPQSLWSTEPLPFTPKGLAMFQANKPGGGPRQASPEQVNDPAIEANPPGLYRTLLYSRPFEFVQLQDHVIQMFAWNKIWRNIYTDGRPVPDDIPAGPYWFGYSVGKWDGDTLVVTTLALDSRAWFDQWGVPISDDARVEERWHLTAPGKLQLTITVHDPVTYSKPWTSRPLTYNLQHDVEPEEIITAPMDEKVFNEQVRIPAGFRKK